MIARTPSSLLVLGLFTGLATAGSSPLDRADAPTRARFERVAEAYKRLASYQDAGRFRRTITVSGRERKEETPLSWSFARPNRIAIDAGEVRVLGDGKTLTTILAPTRRYLSAPASPAIDRPAIADGPAGAVLFGGATGPPAQLLLGLLLGGDPASALPDRCTALKLEPDAEAGGRTLFALRLTLGDEPALRVLIDPETNLIRRMEYVLDAKAAADRLPRAVGDVAGLAIAWDSGEIRTENLDAATFRFDAPEGYAQVKAAEPNRAAKAEKHELVGKPAPDFSIEVLDGPGKIKALTRQDLAGKVVVLDFWATWCGPCLLELPEVQKLAESLAKAGKAGVVIVAVSQDRAPDDGSSTRKLVEDLLREKSIDLASGPIARTALDPAQVVGEAFGVKALPTLVVIDPKGVVQSVHVGFAEDIKDVLAAEIDALLEGKSLLDPAERPANK